MYLNVFKCIFNVFMSLRLRRKSYNFVAYSLVKDFGIGRTKDNSIKSVYLRKHTVV